MRLNAPLVCLAGLGIGGSSAFAFVPSPFTRINAASLNLKLLHPEIHSRTNLRRIKMSSTEDEEEVTGELAKLIGKRASIAKKSDKTLKTVVTPDDPDLIDETTAKMYEGKSGMEIFEMPEFVSKRPLKKPKEIDDSSRGGNSEDKSSKSDSEYYIDYQADYNDENDFHVPNRLGFSTIAWGDELQGFKSGKKLKKKEIKAGYFLAGDVQVRSVW